MNASENEVTEVNGLRLPGALVAAINSGRWTVPKDNDLLRAVFPLMRPVHPLFYGWSGIRRENESWPSEDRPSYLGKKEAVEPPGDIDPRQSVLIGDLGPDLVIALDYRVSRENPSVVYLVMVEEVESHWVQAAPDIESLLGLLGTAVPVSGEVPASPRVKHISWGRMEVEGVGSGRDFKLYPGGGREWDWTETNTHHQPGIQPTDVQELLDKGSEVVVLSRGMQLVLQTCPETVEMLQKMGVRVIVEETNEAVRIYNQLVENRQRVGGLFHSTC